VINLPMPITMELISEAELDEIKRLRQPVVDKILAGATLAVMQKSPEFAAYNSELLRCASMLIGEINRLRFNYRLLEDYAIAGMDSLVEENRALREHIKLLEEGIDGG
jgi:hypothetical protein